MASPLMPTTTTRPDLGPIGSQADPFANSRVLGREHVCKGSEKQFCQARNSFCARVVEMMSTTTSSEVVAQP
jgi:hypothetical protein